MSRRIGATGPLGRLIPVAVLMTISCSPSTPRGAGGEDRQSGIPSTTPYIVGTFTAVSPSQLRIEENPAESSGSSKTVLRLTGHTRILHRSGATATISDLRVGQQGSAWARGPIAESYPTQGTASTVVIEAGQP